jgi:hypothetical protein
MRQEVWQGLKRNNTSMIPNDTTGTAQLRRGVQGKKSKLNSLEYRKGKMKGQPRSPDWCPDRIKQN